MEFVLNIISDLELIYKEIFWLKEILLILQSFVVFALVWWFATLKHGEILLLFLSALIGIACSFFGDMGYWNDNDVLKHITPATLYLMRNNKDRRNDIMLFAFLCPFFVISYEFYIDIIFTALSLISHLLLISLIVIARRNIYLILFYSIIVGLLYNYVGNAASPGINDILINPVLITLYLKVIDYYTENNRNTFFLKYFWITLLCFGYFGNWIFYCVGDYSKFAF